MVDKIVESNFKEKPYYNLVFHFHNPHPPFAIFEKNVPEELTEACGEIWKYLETAVEILTQLKGYLPKFSMDIENIEKKLPKYISIIIKKEILFQNEIQKKLGTSTQKSQTVKFNKVFWKKGTKK